MRTTPPTRTRGFVYVVFGESFVAEAIESAKRVVSIHELPCTLITDNPLDSPDSPFESVLVQEMRQGYDDKLLMRLSPYDDTIFLDSDTSVLHPLDELFAVLDRFDLAVQLTPGGVHYKLPDVPDCFYEPSAGILAWRAGSKSQAFFDRWETSYRRIEAEQGIPGAWDQRSLREAIWLSELSFFPIPTEYQFYAYKPEVCLRPVRMHHGRNADDSFLRQQASDHRLRVYVPKVGVVPVYYEATLPELARFATRSATLLGRQLVRRALHWLRIWPLPTKKRPD